MLGPNFGHFGPFWACTKFWIFLKFFLGNQYHFAHKVKTFSVLKYKNKRCEGLISVILGHFGPFWACSKFWIFLKFFLGNQYHFAHKLKTFSVLRYKNKRCGGLILVILGHFGPFWAILGMFKILNFFEIFSG